MSTHPLNLAFRFLLELTAYIAIGYWGWQQGEGFSRYLLALGVPLIWAVLWGTFAVPGDPSRSGKAPVPVPGILRLALELAFFGFASWGLYDAGKTSLGLALSGLVILHYLLSYDRCRWLITGYEMDKP
jgi:hypothetical protein